MLTLEYYSTISGASRGFLKLSTDHTRARRVRHCEDAAHFLSTTTAAIVRTRHPAPTPLQLRVTRCACPVGTHLDAQLVTTGLFKLIPPATLAHPSTD